MTHKEKYNDTATVDVIIPAYRPATAPSTFSARRAE